MSLPTVRLLPVAAADGPGHMAADETLLRSAGAGIASLRFYTWPEATLSLGYFQDEAQRQVDARLVALPFVRRPSGGAAIVHDRELTYALALPAGGSWQTGEPWLCRFHHAVAAALANVGVTAKAVVCGEERKLGEFLCFLHQTPGDLLIGPGKVAGSAQRRHRGATMQHGSILLRQSPHTPALLGIEELGNARLTPEVLSRAILAELRNRTGWAFEPGDWTYEERQHVAELRAGKYTSDAWNRERRARLSSG